MCQTTDIWICRMFVWAREKISRRDKTELTLFTELPSLAELALAADSTPHLIRHTTPPGVTSQLVTWPELDVLLLLCFRSLVVDVAVEILGVVDLVDASRFIGRGVVLFQDEICRDGRRRTTVPVPVLAPSFSSAVSPVTTPTPVPAPTLSVPVLHMSGIINVVRRVVLNAVLIVVVIRCGIIPLHHGDIIIREDVLVFSPLILLLNVSFQIFQVWTFISLWGVPRGFEVIFKLPVFGIDTRRRFGQLQSRNTLFGLDFWKQKKREWNYTTLPFL